MIWSFGLIFTDFHKEFKLLSCILKLVLLDFTVDHTIEWSLISLIIG